MWVWLVVVPFVFILGYPYKLPVEILKLEKPVVTFTSSFWRSTYWSILLLGLASFIVAVAFYLVRQSTAGWATMLGALVVALPGLALGSILIRLHLSYWQHDQLASLTIYRDEQRAEYYNEGIYHRFSLADIVHITTYTTTSSHSRGLPWSHYSYQIFFLQDGTQLLVTCFTVFVTRPAGATACRLSRCSDALYLLAAGQ